MSVCLSVVCSGVYSTKKISKQIAAEKTIEMLLPGIEAMLMRRRGTRDLLIPYV
jgi:hypothetical protein